jgi:hypothetical protein
VDSQDVVAVRPVDLDPDGTLIRYDLQSAADWYAGKTFQFFVFDSGDVWQNVTAAASIKTFGDPSMTYDIGSYRVLVYPAGIHVAAS